MYTAHNSITGFLRGKSGGEKGRIKETGHSKITLLLQLNYGLQNSLLIVKHPEGGCSRIR